MNFKYVFTWNDPGKPREIRRQQNMAEIKLCNSRTAGSLYHYILLRSPPVLFQKDKL
jgi:hypothetical protein